MPKGEAAEELTEAAEELMGLPMEGAIEELMEPKDGAAQELGATLTEVAKGVMDLPKDGPAEELIDLPKEGATRAGGTLSVGNCETVAHLEATENNWWYARAPLEFIPGVMAPLEGKPPL